MVLADAIELVGEDYRQVKWDPRTSEYIEDAEDGGQPSP